MGWNKKTNYKEAMKVVERAMKHDYDDWMWTKNPNCKYISLHIDMRDGECYIQDRNKQDITLEKLEYQYKGADTSEDTKE